MMRLLTAGLVFLAALAVAAQPAPAPALTKAARDSALTRMDSLWAMSYANNDTTIALQLFADNLVVFSANGSTKDKAGELGDVRPLAGLRMQYFRTQNVRTNGIGNLGMVAGDAEWAFEQGGQAHTVRRGYVATYVRGGPLGWRLMSLRMMAPASPSAPMRLASRDTVQALMTAMVKAFEKDPASVARYYTDDAHVLGGGMRAAGRQQIDEYWAGTKGLEGWTLSVADVGGDAERPWVIGQSRLKSSTGSIMATDFVGFLTRGTDGQLRFSADVYAGSVAGP